MIDYFISPFTEFSFMQRALLGCIAISLSAAPIGVFLMLRRMSLSGDAVAHAILPGAAVGFMISGLSIGAMTIGGIIAGSIVVLLSAWVTRLTDYAEDSSMAAFYLISLAIGVLIISVNGSQVDLLHVLFGSALALNDDSLYLLVAVATLSLCTLAIVFRPLVMECIDNQYLRSVSAMSPIAHYSFLILVVVNLVAGFSAMGTLMSVGMMILPGASARYLSKTLDGMLLSASLLAATGSYAGILLSYHANWPTSSAIILVLGAFYLVALIVGQNNGLLSKLIKRKHLTA